MDTRKYRLQSPAPRTSRMLRTGAALFPAGLRVDAACAKSGYRATAARYAPRSGNSSTIPDRCRRSTGMSTRSGGRSAPPGRCWRGLASGAGAGGLRCEWLSATACRLRVHGGMRRPAAGCACVPGGRHVIVLYMVGQRFSSRDTSRLAFVCRSDYRPIPCSVWIRGWMTRSHRPATSACWSGRAWQIVRHGGPS